MVGIASLYFWMAVEFVAAVQIIVYVGGIVGVDYFSIFLTQQSGKEMPGLFTADHFLPYLQWYLVWHLHIN